MLQSINQLHPMWFLVPHCCYVSFLLWFVWRGAHHNRLSHFVLSVLFASLFLFDYEIYREMMRWVGQEHTITPYRLLYLRFLYGINGATIMEVIHYYDREIQAMLH